MRYKKCHDIMEHYLDEWISVGEQMMHDDANGGKDGGKVAKHLLVGEILEQAHTACHIAKEAEEWAAKYHDPAMHKASAYAAPTTMKATV